MAKDLSMPVSTYRQKEQGRSSFTDNEKEDIKSLLSKIIGSVTIDDIFFS